MIITVNRRFQAVLKRHLRRAVTNDVDVDDELRELKVLKEHSYERY